MTKDKNSTLKKKRLKKNRNTFFFFFLNTTWNKIRKKIKTNSSGLELVNLTWDPGTQLGYNWDTTGIQLEQNRKKIKT